MYIQGKDSTALLCTQPGEDLCQLKKRKRVGEMSQSVMCLLSEQKS